MNKKYLNRMNKLSRKIAEKTGLSMHDVDALLKVTAYELVEILRSEQRFYWDGLGVFKVTIKDTGLGLSLRLSEECYSRLNKKSEGDVTDEIILE